MSRRQKRTINLSPSSPLKKSFHQDPPKSPLRKQLVKDLTSYYNLLHETELLNDTTAATQIHLFKGNSPDQVNTYFNDKQSGYDKFIKDIDQYQEVNARSSRLDELKSMMKAELEYIETGHPVDPTYENWEDSIQGYPSFMGERDSSSNFHCGVHYKDNVNYADGKVSENRIDIKDILNHLTIGSHSMQDVCD